jgi:hypothetical protein
VPLVNETGALTISAPAHAVLDLGPARAGAKPVTVLPGRGEDLSGEAVTDAKRPLWWKGPNLTFSGVKPGGRMSPERGRAALWPLRSNDGPVRAL